MTAKKSSKDQRKFFGRFPWEKNVDPNEPIFITRWEFVNERCGYRKKACSYYSEDGTLVDEKGRLVDDTTGIFRSEWSKEDILLFFEKLSEKGDVVYIRNDARKLDLRIVKKDESYSEKIETS